MERTPLGLTIVEPGESPWEDGGSFFGRNLRVIDHLLRLGAVAHVHDAHPPLANPPTAPAAVPSATDGALPAEQTVYIVATAIDAEGGETLPTPMTTAVTPDALGAPAAPTGAADYTAGDLPDNSYYYVLTATDGVGGETPASDLLIVTLEDGHANGQVILDGLQSAATAIGGTAWRLYRAVNGGAYGFLAAGATETFNDDELALRPDVQLPPPDDTTNTTGSGASIGVTVAGLPADAVSYRIYASDDPTFPSPSLLGEWPAAEAATPRVITTLILDSGQPPVVSTSVGGATLIEGGGGAGTPTTILPPFPPAITWPNSLAELESAGLLWEPAGVAGGYGAALVARRVDIEDTSEDVPYQVADPATYPFTAADWLGDVGEYTYDATVGTGGVIGSGVVDVDHLVYRDPAAGAAYGDGQWDALFHIDAAGWERLIVGAVTYADQDEGFLAIVDRAAGQFQIVHMTLASSLTYTVLAQVALPAPGVGDQVQINVRRFGDLIYAMPIVNNSLPFDSWLTADLSAIPTLSNNAAVFGAWGARWTVANALRLWSQRISSPTTITELIAANLTPTLDPLGNPTWQLDDSAVTVLWRSDGFGAGLPDNWQALGNLGSLMNGWDDAASATAALVQWGGRVIFRGYLTNPTGWHVGASIYEFASGIQPGFQDLRFYVGAESSDGTLGIVRIDVLRETVTDPPKMVVGATGLLANATALTLEGVAWDVA